MRWLAVLGLLAACEFRHGAAGTTDTGPGQGSGSDAAGPRDAGPRDAGPRDAPPDAEVDLCLAAESLCTGEGGTCKSGTCEIPIASGSVNVRCPAGMPCRIDCTTNAACKSATLSCGAATSCTIDCQVANSCQSAVFDCRTAGCTVYCRGSNTCMNDSIGCSPSTCTFDCCASNTCTNNSGDTPTYDQLASCPPGSWPKNTNARAATQAFDSY